jgi:glycosyltransferase involved in cell wall biosynthesis
MHSSPAVTANSAPESLRVVLFAIHAWPVVEPRAVAPFGGAETRAWTFARSLAADPFVDCRFVVRTRSPLIRHHRQDGALIVPLPEPLWPIRLQVSKHVSRQSGFPGIRMNSWHPALIWQLPLLAAAYPFRQRRSRAGEPDPRYVRIPGDVFVTFGVNSTSAAVVASAAATDRPSVLCLAWDGDLSPEYLTNPQQRNRYGDTGELCVRTIHSATTIVTQTGWQQRVLLERFGRRSTVIANPIDLAEWDRRLNEDSTSSSAPEKVCLWIGRADSHHKYPERVFRIAIKCPDSRFLMVISGGNETLAQSLRETAPPNVSFCGTVPFPEMPALFRQAFAILSTSEQEGLSNVFLQAVASGVPILSLTVGDEFLQNSRGGLVANGDEELLVSWIRQAQQGCLPDPDVDLVAARNYVIEQHDARRQATRFKEHLLETIRTHQSSESESEVS